MITKVHFECCRTNNSQKSITLFGPVVDQEVSRFKLINTLIGSGRSGAPAVLRCLVTLFLPFPPRES